MSEEEFSDVVWEALKTETSDLRRQQRIIKAFQATRPAPKADGLVEELRDPWLNNPNDTERGPIPEWCHSLLHRAAATLKDRDVVLEEAAEALEPFGNPDLLMQIADDDDEEWAKFRLLCADYRRAGRVLDRIKTALHAEGIPNAVARP